MEFPNDRGGMVSQRTMDITMTRMSTTSIGYEQSDRTFPCTQVPFPFHLNMYHKALVDWIPHYRYPAYRSNLFDYPEAQSMRRESMKFHKAPVRREGQVIQTT